MITRDQALKLTSRDHLHYTGLSGSYSAPKQQRCVTTIGPRGGVTVKVIECRVNGNVQTWKTRPTEFRVPIKYGMREYGEITEINAEYWHLASECAEHYMQTIDNRPISLRVPKPERVTSLPPPPQGCDTCGWTTSSATPHRPECRGVPRTLNVTPGPEFDIDVTVRPRS